MADDDELLDDEAGEASEGGGSEAPLIEEEPPVKCEECAPCKGGAPAWMATFRGYGHIADGILRVDPLIC